MSPEERARAEELAKELLELTGGRYREDGTPKTFDELEIEAGLVSGLITSMAINQAARDLPDEEKPVRCPKCKAVPRKHDPDDDEPIVIETTCGEVGWLTEGYYCRRCRRSFFPSTC